MNASFRFEGGYRLDIGDNPDGPRGAVAMVSVCLVRVPFTPLGDEMERKMLRAGTTVQVDGLPFRLSSNAPAEAHRLSWDRLPGSADGFPPKDGWPDFPSRGWNGEETIFAVSMKPSHARALASAILSAATEARE